MSRVIPGALLLALAALIADRDGKVAAPDAGGRCFASPPSIGACEVRD